MPIPDNEFSNDYQEVAEEHNVSASMAQKGLNCKCDRPLIRLNNFSWLNDTFCYIGEIFVGKIKYDSGHYDCLYNGCEFIGNTYCKKDAKELLEDWFICQIGEEE